MVVFLKNGGGDDNGISFDVSREWTHCCSQRTNQRVEDEKGNVRVSDKSSSSVELGKIFVISVVKRR